MCGIAGLIAEKELVVREALDAMVCAEAHRGPDYSGISCWRLGIGCWGLGIDGCRSRICRRRDISR